MEKEKDLISDKLKREQATLEYYKNLIGNLEEQRESLNLELCENLDMAAILNADLVKMKESMPDFDAETYEKYSKYFKQEQKLSYLTEHANDIKRHIKSAHKCLAEYKMTYEKTQQKISDLETELEQIK